MNSVQQVVTHPESIRLINRLRMRRIRITPQRAMILNVIESMPGHVTAEDVYAQVHRISPYVNLATIYRTLDLLRNLNLVTDADMGTGATHFALRTHADHHHAICRGCRASLEFSPDLLGPVTSTLMEQFGFRAEANHIVVFGWCPGCDPEAKVKAVK